MKKILLLLIFTLSLFSCQKSKREETDKIKIVASTTIVADVISNIGGDKIELTGMIRPGQDPHTYIPVSRDMVAVEESDIVFVNGYGLEEGLLSVLDSIAEDKVIEVSRLVEGEAFKPDSDEQHTDESGNVHPDEDELQQHSHNLDPHTWMSPENVILWVKVIEQTLVQADPGNADYYRNKAESYTKQLQETDEKIRELFSAIPTDERKILTDHYVLGYFARTYDITVSGTILQSTTTNAGISSREMSHLIDLINEEQIFLIVLGNTTGNGIQQLSGTLQKEIDREIRIVSVLTGSLTSEGRGTTYLDYILYNAETIANGLKGADSE